MIEWDVIAVESRGHLRLAVRFAGFFNEVLIEEGAVTWPGRVDISPDAMHDEIRSKGEWVIA